LVQPGLDQRHHARRSERQPASRRTHSRGGAPRSPASLFSSANESYEEAQRVRFLTAEIRNPPEQLTIVDIADTVTIANELGQSRTLHTTGSDELVAVGEVTVSVTTTRDGDRLTVDFHVESNREVRYTYTRKMSPNQLIVDVQFSNAAPATESAASTNRRLHLRRRGRRNQRTRVDPLVHPCRHTRSAAARRAEKAFTTLASSSKILRRRRLRAA